MTPKPLDWRVSIVIIFAAGFAAGFWGFQAGFNVVVFTAVVRIGHQLELMRERAGHDQS